MDTLVSTDWLARNLDAPDIAIVDASAFLPTDGRNPNAEFIEAHIPGARFLDINQVADRTNPAPHMLPSAADFGRAMTELGVGRDDRIVVYDNSPLRTAARGWFMFRHFGAERVAIGVAVAAGAKRLRAVAVTAAKLHPIAPCGACRQVIREFADADVPVASDALDGSLVVTTAGELLPGAFLSLVQGEQR